MNDQVNTPGEGLEEKAAYWFTVLRNEDCPAAKRKAFDLWLSESDSHRQAYKAIEQAWSLSADLDQDPDLLALRNAAIRGSVDQVPSRRRSYVAVAATVFLFAAALSLGWQYFGAAPQETVRFTLNERALEVHKAQLISTAVGERSTFLLEDGSSVELNTATELKVLFGDEKREIILLKGQALFEVASNPDRPFVVFAADRRITALGTEFEVRLDRQDVSVTLLEGKVEVAELALVDSTATSNTLRSIELLPGQRVSGDLAQTLEVSTDDLNRALSWREGRLQFKNERLSDVVYEINRYSVHEVRLVDSSLGEIRVSGTFKAGTAAGFVSALTTLYPLESRTQTLASGIKTFIVTERGREAGSVAVVE